MYYAQFYDKDLSGTLSEVCGSDGVCILDGRLSKYNMRMQAIQYAYSLIKIRKFSHFRIFKGISFLNSKPIDQKYFEIKYPDKFCIERGYDYAGIKI